MIKNVHPDPKHPDPKKILLKEDVSESETTREGCVPPPVKTILKQYFLHFLLFDPS